MAALDERPRPRAMRLYLDGLALVIGPSGSSDGYRAVLDPSQARELAIGLVRAADAAERAAQPALDELDALLQPFTGELEPWGGDDA